MEIQKKVKQVFLSGGEHGNGMLITSSSEGDEYEIDINLEQNFGYITLEEIKEYRDLFTKAVEIIEAGEI